MAGTSETDPNLVTSYQFPQLTFSYTERDAAVYALGVGACSKDAVDDKELKYVYHHESIQILNKATISGFHDKGKSAILEVEISSYEKESGVLLCVQRMSLYLRGAGGFSKSSQPYSFSKYPSSQALTYKIPKSQPFAVFEECTQPSQALLYRLSGDYNPLHSDPRVAEMAGFSLPILHGLCTLGFAVRAIIYRICHGDQNMIRNITGRFLLHVYPGETLITEMWVEGMRVVYQLKVKERNKAALSGVVTLKYFTSSL
ncbi:glycoside hydrolase 18 protein, variant 2 [Salvia divinorum]|uniref:Glycoside hydrolase 18 protein, variant 2 n=1 Tax=Salvia divinorum TaxID=28513 RepID=A0ABD1FQV6_SALDI